MESKPPQNPPRKLKFVPKIPPRRAPKLEVKNENVEDVDAVQAMNLMKQFQERSMRGKPKIEKKAQVSVFGFGGSSTKLKSYGVPKRGSTDSKNQGSASIGGASSSIFKEYMEPWDYYSYYPVTLPLRRPYAGNPAILDMEEFGEASETANYDENSTSPALDLGLMEENVEASMFFLQLPPTVPMSKRSAATDGHEVKESASGCKLDGLPAGHIGKMLVYRSGAVKLKLGDTLYNVSPGMDCVFAEDVAAINKAEKRCCVIAEIDKHATITPDVDAIINSMVDL